MRAKAATCESDMLPSAVANYEIYKLAVEELSKIGSKPAIAALCTAMHSGVWQTLRHQMTLLKRHLLNPERHLQATKATLIEVAKSAYEKSLIIKAVITYIDKLSEEPNHGA